MSKKENEKLSALYDEITNLIDKYNLLSEKENFENKLCVVTAKKYGRYYEISHFEFRYDRENENVQHVEGVHPTESAYWFPSSMQC
jgi:hypothetical protein